MFAGINKVLLKIFGSRNERLVKSYSSIVGDAEQYEEQVKSHDDEALKGKTAQFKARLAAGAQAEDILAETFAVVREAARRNVEMRHA